MRNENTDRRRRAPRWAIALWVGCVGLIVAVAQQEMADVEIVTTKVTDHIYMLEGRGGNIAVSVGDDGVLMVDSQFAPLADRIRAAVASLNPSRLRFLVNTHFHGDHVGGNRIFGKVSTVVAHRNVRERLATEQSVLGNKVEPSPAEALPMITYDESMSVHFNGERVDLMHIPTSHTDGDTAVFFTGSNVVHLGDLFFAGRFPFVDLENGGDVQGLTRSIARVIEEVPADAKIVPGHGPLSTVEDLRTYHGMLVATARHVQAGIDAGKDLDTLKSDGLPEQWAEWGTGFINTERWISILHASLTREG